MALLRFSRKKGLHDRFHTTTIIFKDIHLKALSYYSNQSQGIKATFIIFDGFLFSLSPRPINHSLVSGHVNGFLTNMFLTLCGSRERIQPAVPSSATP